MAFFLWFPNSIALFFSEIIRNLQDKTRKNVPQIIRINADQFDDFLI